MLLVAFLWMLLLLEGEERTVELADPNGSSITFHIRISNLLFLNILSATSCSLGITGILALGPRAGCGAPLAGWL